MPVLDARRLHAEMLPVVIIRENANETEDFDETKVRGLATFITPELVARCEANDQTAARREAQLGELIVIDLEQNSVWAGFSPSAYPGALLISAGHDENAPTTRLTDNLTGAVSGMRGWDVPAQEAGEPAPQADAAGGRGTITGWIRALGERVFGRPEDQQRAGAIVGWVRNIGEQANYVASHPENFSSGMQASALSLNLVNSYGPDAGEPPVSIDALVRLNRAAQARESIALFNPDHPDAAQKPRALEAILENASNGAGVNLRAGATWRPGASVSALPERMANDRLTREVFGAMTSTPIETLRATSLDATLAERIRGSLRGENVAMDAEWSGAVRDKLNEVFGRRMGAYRAEIEAFRKDGADMLFVSDMQGQYLYAWPSEDTHPVASVRGEPVPAVPANIPDEAEVARLETVARDLAMDVEHGLEGEFDEDLDEENDRDAPGLDAPGP